MLAVFIVISAIAFGWLAKQSYSVYKLTRGVGDTWFHTADGKRWFRLDEQRQDVPLVKITPYLQQASDAWSLRHPVVYTLIWVVVLLAVFVPLSVRIYQRTASR